MSSGTIHGQASRESRTASALGCEFHRECYVAASCTMVSPPGGSVSAAVRNRSFGIVARRWFEARWQGVSNAVWFRLPDCARLRASATGRRQVRQQIGQARSLLLTARVSEPGEPQNVIGATALRTWLCAVALAADDCSTSAADAVRRGAARVEATLDRPALRETLARFGDPERPPPSAPSTFKGLLDLCAWIESLIDVGSDRDMRVRRFARWGSAVVGLLLVIRALFGDKNLALGKKVTASSICSLTPPPSLGMERLGRLVDGLRVQGGIAAQSWAHGTFAMCTEMEAHPWITVDLGAERVVTEIVVYNRADCCWGINDTPLEAQLSVDNTNFVTVATRTDPFTDDFPWRQSTGGRRARYIRLFNPSNELRDMAFAEIEIYGH